jgi:GH43 family beta-xylosidase
VPATGRSHAGLFWAPSIYRIQNRWLVYFAAQYNAASHALGSAAPKPGTMVIGVATANSLAGPWRTKILHYPAQFNSVNAPAQQEIAGGDIDPGVVRDPRNGQFYLFWAQQRQQIWEGALSPDGMTLAPNVRVAIGISKSWECDPLSRKCTVEGPEPFYHDGYVYLMYSAASTWNSSYAVGVAAATVALDAAHPFVKLPEPILQTADGFLGPGRTSHPIIGPSGQSLILYHALLKPLRSHASGARTLMLGTLNWVNNWPIINDGHAH